jgi:hypothetical protein
MEVINIKGGQPDSPWTAAGDGHEWRRGDDESAEAFEARVMVEAEAAGVKSLIIDGLPGD